MEWGRRHRLGVGVVAALCAQLSPAADVFLHGKVTMEDGSPPPKSVTIERPCLDSEVPVFVAATNPKGEFTYKVTIGAVDMIAFNRACVLRASFKGYESTTLDYNDWNLFQDPNLPPIVLIKLSGNPSVNVFSEDAGAAQGVQDVGARGSGGAGGALAGSGEADSRRASGLS